MDIDVDVDVNVDASPRWFIEIQTRRKDIFLDTASDSKSDSDQ